ncbi:hypothetical protein C8F01DRAFT_1264849 [Mycena amicta]|nr:hypothetical protein C8F01DRAFT_1264849 [Mycena amicta]
MQDLPTEILQQITDELPLRCLNAFSRASRRLREVSQRRLFAHMMFHPYALAEGTMVRTVPDEHRIQDAHRRLEFWSSAAISRYVRKVRVAPWGPWINHGVFESWRFSAPTGPLTLLPAFFGSLQKFTKLQELALQDIEVLPNFVAHISISPLLQTIVLENCKLPAGGACTGTPGSPRLRRLIVRTDAQSDSLPSWLPLLSASAGCLHILHLRNGLEALAGACDSETTLPAFPHVTNLTLRDTSFPNVRLLKHFPAVQRLHLSVEEFSGLLDSDLTVIRLPELTSLSVSCDLLPSLLHHEVVPNLSHLDVLECSPEIMVSALERTLAKSISTIRSLVLHLDCDESVNDGIPETLSKILAYFPTVSTFDLTITAAGSHGLARKQLCTLLSATSFPGNLRELQIRSFSSKAPKHDAMHSEFTRAREALAQRSPQLRYVWLEALRVLYRWQRVDQGSDEFLRNCSVEDARKEFTLFVAQATSTEYSMSAMG